jgi:hypothetical protein
MNSSGIKRGLATTAVSALAIAGIPFIASSASAATNDTIALVSAGPVRNAGTEGGVFRLKVSPTVVLSNLKLSNPNYTAGPNTPNQTVAIEDRMAAPTDSNPNDGLDEVLLYISVTGTNYNFGIYEDVAGGTADTVDAGEPRTAVTGVTAGTATQIAVTPSYQTVPESTESGAYTVTVKDAAGNTTQLSGTEVLDFNYTAGGAGVVAFTLADDDVTVDGSIDAEEMPLGTTTFTASSADADLYTLSVDGTNGTVDGKSGTARLDVNGTVAALGNTEIDLVTGADTRDGYANTAVAQVRPDQATLTFNLKGGAGKAGQVVRITATGGGVKINGKDSDVFTTTLDSAGNGSIVVPVDAATIASNDTVSISGSFTFLATYKAPAITSATADATTYISAFGGTVSPTVTVLDQYGDPITGVFVAYERDNGANDDAGVQSARKQVDSNGQVTFDIKDTKATATNDDTDDLFFYVYAGQLDNTALASDVNNQIVYTADGTGDDFLVRVDGQTPGAASYNPTINPLTDTVAGNGGPVDDSTDESAVLDIVGATAAAAVTVTADNGGLILKDGDTDLADAAASKSGEIGDDFVVVGTKAGVVNVTVTSGGKTQTATVNVKTLADFAPLLSATSADTARNIAVTGPESVVAGDVVEFTVVITDAFGNPVQGFNPNGGVTTVLTGPAQVKGNSGASNAAGEIVYTVELDQDARNPITLQVTGNGADFGAAADKLDNATPTPTPGVGLSASVQTASASADVVNIERLQQAVADAEAAVAAAEADLAEAKTDLDVAQAQLAIASSEVDRLRERKQNLRQKLNKAKKNGNRQKAKTTRQKLRKVKSQLNDAKAAVVVAQTRVDGEQTVVDLRQDQVDAALEALAAAQAELDEAQN